MTSLSSMFILIELSTPWLQFASGECVNYTVLIVCLYKHVHDCMDFIWKNLMGYLRGLIECFESFRNEEEMKKHGFQQIKIQKLDTYYTDSFFPCIRLDIHRNSWPPNLYRSLHFYTDPFHIHWRLENTYTQSWISFSGN